jgi:hypothetical protein
MTEDQEHDTRWARINHNMRTIGYAITWVRYEDDILGRVGRKYRLTRLHPFEVLGHYEDEGAVYGMVKLLWTQHRLDEGEVV